ncbi:MAG TPA: tandem-95 repeat protein, partial [Paracoccus sp.]|nr:tandem-95 repeat protein [Paracoccus sp. (in: a-proteobacteria)]
IRIVAELDQALDPAGFRLGDVRLGDIVIDLPEDRAFHQSELDLTGTRGYVVRVSAGIDGASGIATWLIQAIDPATGEMMVGGPGLLVGDNPTGGLAFGATARPRAADGTEIRFRARVLFDNRPPEDTNEAQVVLDRTPPQTQLQVTRIAGSDQYVLDWTAQDDLSGLRHVSLFVATNGGAFALFQGQSTETTALFQGSPGQNYEFLALATDMAGNTERPPAGVSVPADGFTPDLGGGAGFGAATTAAPRAAPPAADAIANPLFAEAAQGVPAPRPPIGPSFFDAVASPFAAAAFARGFGAVDTAGIGVTALAQAADGTLFVVAGPERSGLYRIPAQGDASDLAREFIRLDAPVYDIAFDAEGRLWAMTGLDLRQIDPESGAVLGRYGEGLTQSLAIAADGRIYVSSGRGVEIFDPRTETFAAFATTRVGDLAFAPDGQLWATSWPERGDVLRFDDQGRPEIMAELQTPVDSLVFGAEGSALDGLLFLSGNIDPATGRSVLALMDVATRGVVMLGYSTARGDNLVATEDGRILLAHGAGVDVLNPTTAPRITAISPGSGAVLTNPVTTVQITFDTDMLAGDALAAGSVLNPSNYIIETAAGTRLPVLSVSYEAQSRRVILSLAGLESGDYVVSVAGGLQSFAGLELGVGAESRFSVLTDFSAILDLDFAATRRDRGDGTLSFDLEVTNLGADTLTGPLRLLLDPARYFTAAPIGTFGDGRLWVVELAPEAGVLAPGQTTPVVTTSFLAPQSLHFDVGFGLYALPRLNTAPQLLEPPSGIAFVDELYSETIQISDAEGGPFGFVLLEGPERLTVDPETGEVRFNPDARTPAIAPVVVRVFDRQGAFVDVAWLLDVEGGNRPPEFLSTQQDFQGAEGVAFETRFLARDPDFNVVTMLAEGLPPGAQFDGRTGILNWTPDYGDAGIYSFIVIASDGAQTVRLPVELRIAQRNAPPDILPVPEQRVREGDPVRFMLAGRDPDLARGGPALRFSAPVLPAGAELDPVTGVFEWIPGFTQEGIYDIRFQVSDGELVSETTARIIVENANAAPVFVSLGRFDLIEGQPFALQLLAIDPDNPAYRPPVVLGDGSVVFAPDESGRASVSYAVTGLPDGAEFNAESAMFFWTPALDQAGRYEIRVIVTDDGDGTGVAGVTEAVVTLDVANTNLPPVIEPVGNRVVAAGDMLEIPITVTDGDGGDVQMRATLVPLASADRVGIDVQPRVLGPDSGFASFVAGPDGGILRVAPEALDRGVYVVTLVAEDDGGGVSADIRRDEQSFILTVEAASVPPRLDVLDAVVAVIGQEMRLSLRATDPDGDVLTFEAENLPEGAQIIPSLVYGHAELVWTPGPADEESRTITVSVRDDGNGGLGTVGSDSRMVQIRVRSENSAPLLLPVGDQRVAEGETLEVSLFAIDPDGDRISYLAENLPPGAELDVQSGVLRWIPGRFDSGTYTDIVLIATDGAAESRETITIVVDNTNADPILTPLSVQRGREGQAMSFRLLAGDPDDDALVFRALDPLPAGAQLNAATGQVTWSPDFQSAGNYALRFAVEDGWGGRAETTVSVVIDNVNRAPVLAVSNALGAVAQLLELPVLASDPDPDDALTFTFSGLPQDAQFDAQAGVIRWTPGAGQIGDHLVLVTVSDGTATDSRTLLIRVTAVPEAPQVTLVATPDFPVLPGQQVTLTLRVAGLGAVAETRFVVDGTVVMPGPDGTLTFTAGTPGRMEIRAEAVGVNGAVGVAQTVIRVRDPSDTAAPVVALDPTLAHFPIRGPVAITGEVSDQALDSWSLVAVNALTGTETVIASGVEVQDGILTMLDPAVLPSGFYTLRLEAIDLGARRAQASLQVEVLGTNQVSRPQSAASDLVVDIGTNALALTRLHDTGLAHKTGVFGSAWRAPWASFDLAFDPLSTGRSATGVPQGLSVQSRVQLSLPDGTRVGFSVIAELDPSSGGVLAKPVFVADDPHGWQLEARAERVLLSGGLFFDPITGVPWDPAGFADPILSLLSPDGTRYAISGTGAVRAITFADGAEALIADTGIAHGGDWVATFTRDLAGRITAVDTVDGQRVVYDYDPDGRMTFRRDVSAGSGDFLAYDQQGRLIASSGQGLWFDAAQHFTPRPLGLHIAALADLPALGTTLQFGEDGRALLTMSLRESEVRNGPALLALQIEGNVSAALPDGGAQIISANFHGGVTTLILRVEHAGVHAVELSGAAENTAGITLSVLGDLTADGRVDATDLALLPGVDLDGDGVAGPQDSALLIANLGFSVNRAPEARDLPMTGIAGVPVRISLADIARDPEGDRISAAIREVTGGTARLIEGGQVLVFASDPGFSGTAQVRLIVDDGHSGRIITLDLDIVDVPLLSLEIDTRMPWIMRGETFVPRFSGRFEGIADPVVLPEDYVSLELGNPDVADLTADGRIVGRADGLTTLIARSGDALAVTVLRVGAQSDSVTLGALVGLEPYPDAVTLSTDGGTRQILLLDFDGRPDDLAARPAQFFSSNQAVATVDADGLIRAVGAGRATITVIRDGADARVEVLVAEPQAGTALLGRDGGVIRNADGYEATIAPGALSSAQGVRIETLDPADLPIPFIDPSFGWTLGAAFEFDLGDTPLQQPAQLAIPTDFDAGDEVIFYKYMLLPTESGWQWGWGEVDTGFVDAEGRARTASPPADGIGSGGVMVVSKVDPERVVKTESGVRLTLSLPGDPMRASAATRILGGTPMGAVQNGDRIAVSFNIGAAVTQFFNIASNGVLTGAQRVIDFAQEGVDTTTDIFNRLGDILDAPQVSRLVLQRLPDGGITLEIEGSNFAAPGTAAPSGSLLAGMPSLTWVVLGTPEAGALPALETAILAALAEAGGEDPAVETVVAEGLVAFRVEAGAGPSGEM